MADNSEHEARFWSHAEPLLSQPEVSRSTMMGLPCLRIRGAFFASFDRSTGSLLVKLPEAEVDRLVAEGKAQTFSPAGRRFREWASVPVTRSRTWPALLDHALAHVRDLPRPAVAPAAAVTAFAGYPREAFDFLDGLAADNTKRFFDEHREVYESSLARPTKLLVDRMTPMLRESVHPQLRGVPKAGQSLFRINRDVRFSHDKTPYNTHVDVLWWIGDDRANPRPDPRSCPAVILRLTSTTVLLGAGQFVARGAALDAYRARLLDPTSGTALRAAVEALLATGSELSEPARARPPRGFPADHPNADLARRDGFHLHHTQSHPPSVGEAGFAAWCGDELIRYGPLLRAFTA